MLAQLPPRRPEVERVGIGPGVLFWSVANQGRSRASLMKLPKQPAYRDVTIRNHNTVRRLGELLEAL